MKQSSFTPLRLSLGLGITINKEMSVDEAKRVKIEQLAAVAHEKGERYRMLGAMNAPSDPDEKKKSAIEYALARGEMIDAHRDLEDVLNA